MAAFDLAELRFAAARHALGVLTGAEIVALARQAVEAGAISEATSELATVRDAYPAVGDLRQMFAQWLRGEGIALPDTETAIWIALRGHLAVIADGEIPPREGLGRVMDEIVWSFLWNRPGKHVGESHDLGELVEVYYAYDEGDERELDARAVKLAWAWLAKHG